MEPLAYDIYGEMMTVEAITQEAGRLAAVTHNRPLSYADTKRLAELANALAMATAYYEGVVSTMLSNVEKATEEIKAARLFASGDDLPTVRRAMKRLAFIIRQPSGWVMFSDE